MDKYDVVIVGSGIGGLCCGSILALSGKYNNEILFLMCAKKLFSWKYIETKKSFWRDF